MPEEAPHEATHTKHVAGAHMTLLITIKVLLAFNLFTSAGLFAVDRMTCCHDARQMRHLTRQPAWDVHDWRSHGGQRLEKT